MSKTVDERVVSMQFDNKQFESGIQTSLGSIDKLKNSLNFKGAEQGLNNVSSAAKGIDMSGLASGIQTVCSKFSVLDAVAFSVIKNITDRAVNAGIQLVKSLSIDQVTEGWTKYGEKTQAVQTIMAATAKDFADTDEQMGYVNEQLDKLNWFTDETSYNFLDMVNNIGKFTSNGVKLDDAVTSMQGISTWAAISGANTQEAGRAMYNLSQAMAVGSVKLQDWKSIENANMATLEFKETAIKTAVECGMLADAGDGLYKTMQGNTVSATNFNEALSDQWFTSEVLVKSLDKYGAFATKLNDAYVKLGDGANYTTSEIIEMIDQYKDGSLDMEEVMKNTELSAEELKTMFEELGSEEYALGRKSFAAAQEAKTFEEAINATKDAVSTGWMNTFEIIFGNYEDAKKLWTTVANEMYEIFAESSNARNEMLRGWAELGGRDSMLNAISNSWQGLKTVLDIVKESFREVFPAMTSERLFQLTKAVENATTKFKVFSDAFKMLNGKELDFDEQSAVMASGFIDVIKKLQSAFTGFFTVIKFGFTAVKTIIGGVFKLVGGLASIISTIFNSVKTVAEDISNFINNSFGGMGESVIGATGALGNWISWLKDTTNESNIFVAVVEKIISVLQKVIDKFKELGSSFKEKLKWPGLEGFLAVMGSIWKVVGKVTAICIEFGKKAGKALASAFRTGDIKSFVDLVNGGLFTTLLLSAKNFMKESKGTFGRAKGFFATIKDSFRGINQVLNGVKGCLEAYQQDLKANVLLKIAAAIAILAASLVIISMIDPNKLTSSFIAITALFADLMSAMAIFTKFGGKMNKANKATIMLIGMSVALLITATTLKKISSIGHDDLVKGIAGLTAVIYIMVGAAAALGAIGKYSKKMVSSTFALIILATAASMMANVCKKMKDVEWESMAKAGAMVAGMVAIAAGIGAVGTYAKKMTRSAIALVIIGAAMEIVANVCKKMKGIEWSDLAKAGVMMYEMVAIAAGIGAVGTYAKKMTRSAIALVIIGAAMEIMADVCSKFGAMDWEVLRKAGVAIGGILILAAGFGSLAKYTKGLTRASIALVIIGAAMEIMADVCSKFGVMDWGALAKAGVAIAGILGLAVAFGVLAKFAPSFVGAAAGLIVMAIALNMFVPVLQKIGAMSIGEIAKSLITIAAAFAVFGIAAALLAPVIPSMIGIAAAFALLGVAALGIGAGLALIAAGFAMLAVSAATGATAIVAALAIIVTGLLGLVPTIVQIVGEAINELCKMLMESVPLMCETIEVVVTAILETLTKLTPPLFDFLGFFLDKTLAFLEEFIPKITESAGKMILGFLDGINKHIGEITESAVMVIVNFINGLTNKMPDIINSAINIIMGFINALISKIPDIVNAAFEIIIAFINGLADAIENNTDKLLDAVERLFVAVINAAVKIITRSVSNFKKAAHDIMNSGFIQGVKDKTTSAINTVKEIPSKCVEKIKEKLSEFKDAGKYLIDGFKEGIKSKIEDVKESVKNVAETAVDKFKGFLHINSPSRVFRDISACIPEGVAVGIDKNIDYVEDSIEDMTDVAIDGAKGALSSMSEILNSEVDTMPTITPVVDMGSVNASKLKLGGTINASVGKPVNALSRIVADAQSEINSSNNEVISAIRGLREDLSAFYDSDGQEVALYVDSKKLATSLAKPMNRQLNILSRREAAYS